MIAQHPRKLPPCTTSLSDLTAWSKTNSKKSSLFLTSLERTSLASLPSLSQVVALVKTWKDQQFLQMVNHKVWSTNIFPISARPSTKSLIACPATLKSSRCSWQREEIWWGYQSQIWTHGASNCWKKEQQLKELTKVQFHPCWNYTTAILANISLTSKSRSSEFSSSKTK